MAVAVLKVAQVRCRILRFLFPETVKEPRTFFFLLIKETLPCRLAFAPLLERISCFSSHFLKGKFYHEHQ